MKLNRLSTGQPPGKVALLTGYRQLKEEDLIRKASIIIWNFNIDNCKSDEFSKLFYIITEKLGISLTDSFGSGSSLLTLFVSDNGQPFISVSSFPISTNSIGSVEKKTGGILWELLPSMLSMIRKYINTDRLGS